MSVNIKPRNDFVLVRIMDKGMSDGGVVLPQISVEGKNYVVEAIGPKVDGLKEGDRVLMTGRRESGDWSLLPGCSDLIIIREANVVLIYVEDKVIH